jgi:excisionase family DNA binding protein
MGSIERNYVNGEEVRVMEAELRPLVLSVDEAAVVLGVSPATVLKLTRTGEIRAVRLGRRILIPRHEVARIVGEAA